MEREFNMDSPSIVIPESSTAFDQSITSIRRPPIDDRSASDHEFKYERNQYSIDGDDHREVEVKDKEGKHASKLPLPRESQERTVAAENDGNAACSTVEPVAMDVVKDGREKSSSEEEERWAGRDHQRAGATYSDRSERDVPELVDCIESALEKTSKGDRGAFDHLMTMMSVFLPLSLLMADELSMLKENTQKLVVQKRNLQKLLRRDQKAEKSPPLPPEMISVGTSAMSQDSDPQQPQKQEAGAKGHDASDDERGRMKKELQKQRHQINELRRVNHSWEGYSRHQVARHEAEMKEEAAKLASAEEIYKNLEKRVEDKFREYDQTLLILKNTSEQNKLAAAQYKTDRDNARQKYEVMKRNYDEVIREKNEEIKRLNKFVQNRNTEKTGKGGKTEGPGVEDSAIIPDRNRARANLVHLRAAGKRGGDESSSVAAAPATRKKHWQSLDKVSSRPLSPHENPAIDITADSPISLTKTELKEQIQLCRQQIDIFHSDFHQERRDREKAIGQVDILKQELEKSKTKLKELQNRRKYHERDMYLATQRFGKLRHSTEAETTRAQYNDPINFYAELE